MSGITTAKIKDAITLDDHNANKGTIRGMKLLDDSLRKHGAGRSILLDRKGRAIAGNKTTQTAVDIGLEDVIIVKTNGRQLVAVQREDLDLDDPATGAREMAYLDNRVGQLDLDWDSLQLAADLEAGLDLSDLFDVGELSAILEGAGDELLKGNGKDVPPQEDKAAELAQKYGTATGQIWQLGEHRLAVGDCTDRMVVESVMRGEKTAPLVTSPPYGVGKEYESGGVTEWRNLINRCFTVACDVTDLWFVNLANRRTGNDGYECHTFGLMVTDFEAMGYGLLSLRIWIKDPSWAGQTPYWHNTYKPVDDFEFLGLFASKKPAHKKRLSDEENNEWGFRGVWDIDSVRANKLHSAMFPVELPTRALRLLTDDGATIYEPFSGSGTTLIACENLNRKCRGIEIDPGYSAISIERWHQLTGRDPVLLT